MVQTRTQSRGEEIAPEETGPVMTHPKGVNPKDCRVRNQNICYEGYNAEETLRAFLLGERGIDVVRTLDR